MLKNEGICPRDIWTPLGFIHVLPGATIEAELGDEQVLELLELGFSEVGTAPAKRPKKQDNAAVAVDADASESGIVSE